MKTFIKTDLPSTLQFSKRSNFWERGSTKFVTKSTHPKSVCMPPNGAHMKIHQNPTIAASLFRSSKIQDGWQIQDGHQNAQQCEIDLYWMVPKVSFQLKFITATDKRVIRRFQTPRTFKKAEKTRKRSCFVYISFNSILNKCDKKPKTVIFR